MLSMSGASKTQALPNKLKLDKPTLGVFHSFLSGLLRVRPYIQHNRFQCRGAEVLTGKPLTRPLIANSKWKSSAALISMLALKRHVLKSSCEQLKTLYLPALRRPQAEAPEVQFLCRWESFSFLCGSKPQHPWAQAFSHANASVSGNDVLQHGWR